jgi:20S proteasome alpha/beta subunit
MRIDEQLRYPLRTNFAGWDNDPRPRVREEVDMTFTYAVIADGGIVLAADSQVTHTHPDQFGVIGTYEGCRGKIRRIGNRFAFSIAGNGGLADTLLSKVNTAEAANLPSFGDVVHHYGESMRDELRRLYPQEPPPLALSATFIFCGYTHGASQLHVPQIVKLDSTAYFAQNPITGRGMAASGAERHGAAYYLRHRFYREEPLMPLEQAKLFAYCIAREVADQDNSVGGPIEVEVITPQGAGPLIQADLAKYEKGRQEIISTVRSFVESFK